MPGWRPSLRQTRSSLAVLRGVQPGLLRPPIPRRSRPWTGPGRARRSRCRRRSGGRWPRRRAPLMAPARPCTRASSGGGAGFGPRAPSRTAFVIRREHFSGGRRPERAGLGELAGGTEGGEAGEDVAGGVDFPGNVGSAEAQLPGRPQHPAKRPPGSELTTGASAGPASEPSQARSRRGIPSVPRTIANASASRDAAFVDFFMSSASLPVLRFRWCGQHPRQHKSKGNPCPETRAQVPPAPLRAGR